MRRTICLLLLAGLALPSTGCLFVAGNRGRLTASPYRKQAIVIDGEIYIVDTKNETARKIEPQDPAEVEVEIQTDLITTETEAAGA